MNGGLLIRLAGITAHYRDPRYNTGAIGRSILPIATLHCPPPCTVHAMLCAAKGGWVEPSGLLMGWRMDFDSVGTDFQTCQLPKRKSYSFRTGLQKLESSPRVREFLTFPRLTILILGGAEPSWFRSPANPLLFGRSEDLGTRKEILEGIRYARCDGAEIVGQCLPPPLGVGPLYSAPLYFQPGRLPIAMSPKIDSRVAHPVRISHAGAHPQLVRLNETGEAFFLWDFGRAAS